MQTVEMNEIARIRTDFGEKFGIPRQSGLVEGLEGRIVFAPEYRDMDALRGLEGFSHLWLIWEFSENLRQGWSPMVRPPRLGGNTRMGVFATRSPFRPNPIGLSCVKLVGIENGQDGPVIVVSGADLMDGTPILDIKPYIPYADCRPEALGGFAQTMPDETLEVVMPDVLPQSMPKEKLSSLKSVLAHDPRPSYQDDPRRVYGISFAGHNVRFTVAGKTLVVTEISQMSVEQENNN